MKVLLVDQIAKVNYKYTFPLANGLEKAGAKVLLAIDQKQEKENCRCERINLFNTDEKNVGKLEKMQNYIASYKKIGELLRTEKFDVLHSTRVKDAIRERKYQYGLNLYYIRENEARLSIYDECDGMIRQSEYFYDKYSKTLNKTNIAQYWVKCNRKWTPIRNRNGL